MASATAAAAAAAMAGGTTATSMPSVNPADNFFSAKGTDYTWTDSFTLNFNPSSTINDHLLSFEIPRMASPNFVFLKDMVLQLSLKLVDKDDAKPADDAKVAPINLFPSALFRTARLFLNEVLVSSCEGNYPLRCYTDFVTNTNFNGRAGGAQTYGFYADAGQTFQDNAANTGFIQRRLLFGQYKKVGQSKTFIYDGETVPIFSKLITDMSSCNLPLLPDVGVRLELAINEPSYYIQVLDSDPSAKKYKLKIDQANLLVPVKTMASSMALELEKRMVQGPLHYPLTRVEVKKLNIAPGLASYSTDALTQSSINPQRVLLALIPTSVSTGGYGKNPLEFCCTFKKTSGDPVEITRASLSINGSPLEHYDANTHNKLITSTFNMFYKNLGGDAACQVSLKDFANGYTMFLWDTTKANRAYNIGARQPVKNGGMRLELTFSETLPEAVDAMIFSEYHASVDINKNRAVAYNYIS